MPPLVFLDFETRSKAKLKSCGVYRYAEDPSTDVMCMACSIDRGAVELWANPHIDSRVMKPTSLYDIWTVIKNGAELHAHNAQFERVIWQEVCVKRYGWPEIAIDRWHCTAARAAAAGLPRSLKDAGAALGLSKQKDMDGHHVMMKMARPRKPSKHNPAVWNENPDDFDKLYEYCKDDVRSEMAIHDATPPLSEAEQRLYTFDQQINQRGIPIDRETIEAAIEVENQHVAALTEQLRDLTGGEVRTANQRDRLLSWLIDQGLNIENVQADTLRDCLKTDIPKQARQVIEIRLELGRAASKKLKAMLTRASADGRIRGGHLFYGAHTGRWAGSGIQPHNMLRDGFEPDEIEPVCNVIRTRKAEIADIIAPIGEMLAKITRPMIRAEDGKTLIIADKSQIECRVLAWLAGERGLINAFARGEDVYCNLGSKIYGFEINKKDHPLQRFVGKTAQLGLGYQMGAERFQGTCASYGVKIDLPFAEKVVTVYRESSPAIVQFWRRINAAAIEAVKTGKSVVCGKLQLAKTGKWLGVGLPSGRVLHYYDPKVGTAQTPWGAKPQLSYMGVNSMTRKWQRHKTYGGKLTENVVQAISRDFFAGAMRAVESAGYPIVMHVHDELVAEVESGSAEEVVEIMGRVPAWGKGCPLAAEGFESRRFRK